jgi:hypothetical protein
VNIPHYVLFYLTFACKIKEPQHVRIESCAQIQNRILKNKTRKRTVLLPSK